MLVYRRDIDKLKHSVQAHEKRAVKAYSAVFGEKTARRFAQFAQELLDDSSFPGAVHRPKKTFSFETEVNGLATASTFDIAPDATGIFPPTQIVAAPIFDITEEGLRNSHTKPPYIGSYIHEFDHFLGFALAEFPSTVFCQILEYGIGEQINFADPESQMREISIGVNGSNRDEQKRKIQLLIDAVTIRNFEEKATRIIDYLIFREMGYPVEPPYWLGREKTYKQVKLTPLRVIVAYPVDGDPFLNFEGSLVNIAQSLPNWQNHLRIDDPLGTNMMAAYLGCTVRKMRYSRLLALKVAED